VRVHRSKIARTLERVEAALGVMLAGVLCGVFALATIGWAAQILYNWHGWKPLWQPLSLLAGFALTTIVTARLFGRLVRSFDGRSPQIAYHMAGSFARPAWYVRWPLGFAALAMAIGILALGRVWTMLFSAEHPTAASRVFLEMCTFAVMLGAAYASNAYVLCFLRAFHVPRAFVNFVYRSRYVIDLGLALALPTLTDRMVP